VLDGLSLCYAVSLIRRDFKFLAHSTFQKVPELEPYVLPVDFDGASAALRSNIETKKAALKHVRDGGAVVIFPAGRVSTAKTPFGPATDAEWKVFCGSLIQRSGADVVPVYFRGQNSWLFHLASLLGEAMREALLMREIVRRINSEVHGVMGDIIKHAKLAEFENRRDMLDFLRHQVYALEHRESSKPAAIV
jgi:putative hemolysin